MNLIDVYSALQSKRITVEQAAAAMGMLPRTLKFRVSRWGHRLPLLLSTLDKIASNTISRGEAAEVLQVGPREINQLMKNWNVQRPIANYLVMRASSEVKWEIRKKYAIKYISGTMGIAEAAQQAGCSPRQMRRWVSEIIQKHFGMVFKDLKGLSLKKLGRLADEIETAESLDLAKQKVLKAIADGQRALGDVALDRVLAKKRRLQPNVNVRR